MANYEATARSNYVRFDPVKLTHLLSLFQDLRVAVVPETGLKALIADEGTPAFDTEDAELDDLEAFGLKPDFGWVELTDIVHIALAPTSAPFIWLEVGHEKTRSLGGIAHRIAPDGVTTTINLNDIYQDGDTRAEY